MEIYKYIYNLFYVIANNLYNQRNVVFPLINQYFFRQI